MPVQRDDDLGDGRGHLLLRHLPCRPAGLAPLELLLELGMTP